MLETQLRRANSMTDLRRTRHCGDPLSLYLSLKEDHDERTEAALEEMMEKFKW